MESVRPTVGTPFSQKQDTGREKRPKRLFFEVFDKIKGVKFEITTRYAKPGNKVTRNMFCVRQEKIEPDQVGHFYGKSAEK